MTKLRKSDTLIACCSKVSRNPTKASVELDKRLLNMLASCKTRDKKHGQETMITIDMLREFAKTKIGTKCIYCDDILTHKNISFDHIIPLSKGGTSELANIQLICKTCNRQKDKMLHDEFVKLKSFLLTISEPSRKMINQKLSMGGFNASYKRTKQG